MKQTITVNERSINILNKLVLNRHYSGTITPLRFEFERKNGLLNNTGNYILTGNVNSDREYELDLELRFPMNYIKNFLIVFGILFSIVSLIFQYWYLPILFVAVPFTVYYINFKLRRKKEIDHFTSKFLELYKLEYKVI